jgi:phosphoglycolate phosphatase
MRADSLIFDLDGTLWDTCDNCAIAWNDVVERNRIEFRTVVGDDVRGVAGRPHEECIRSVFGDLDEREIEILVRETMEEDNRIIAERGGESYPNLGTVIPDLSRRFRLGIVSNCQEGYIETFLAWSRLGDYFSDFESWGNTGNSKSSNLASLISRNHLECPVFIGDTLGDQTAAADNRIPFIYARYGFGELSGAAGTIDDLLELEAVVERIREPEPRRSGPPSD